MGWSGWTAHGAPGGNFLHPPAVISRNNSVCNIYVCGTDKALWQKAFFDGRWHDWGRHDDGGVLESEPALGSMGSEHEHVFVRGTDNQVWSKAWTPGTGWQAWFNHGAPPGGFDGAPAIVSRNNAVCNIYVRGADNALWQKAFFDGRWHDWGRHDDGGVLASKPALGSMGSEHEHVFVRGTDNQVWSKRWVFVAGNEVSFGVNECVYGWTARYHQAETHVIVRIQLNPDAGISAATMDSLRTTWRNGIIGKWSNRFDCQSGAERLPITFDVQWVTSGAHHVVRVQPGPARSNMGTWDTLDTGDVASHEFGHMIGHPDEYADSACPSRSPVSTGTVMDDNTETVARLYNRITAAHGSGHTPAAHPGEPPEPTPEVAAMTRRVIDNLKPEVRAPILERLRGMAEAGAAPEGAGETEVSFEVSGGAPGERYSYRLGVRGDGSSERLVLDETEAAAPAETARAVSRELAAQVFAAAAEAGLLADDAPEVPMQQTGDILPDTMIATITVRDGESVRRVSVPAEEPTTAGSLPGEPADVPMSTHVQLSAASAEALRPVLEALAAVESEL
jgi:hypothetical protein